MAISNKTHTLSIIREKGGIALCEITRDDADEQAENRYYVVGIDRRRNQVNSVVPADCPESGWWIAPITPYGVYYVANGRKLATARRWFRTASAGELDC